MILSCEEIIFEGEETVSVQLTNESEESYAFKVTTDQGRYALISWN